MYPGYISYLFTSLYWCIYVVDLTLPQDVLACVVHDEHKTYNNKKRYIWYIRTYTRTKYLWYQPGKKDGNETTHYPGPCTPAGSTIKDTYQYNYFILSCNNYLTVAPR